jgi:hypothetical protein
MSDSNYQSIPSSSKEEKKSTATKPLSGSIAEKMAFIKSTAKDADDIDSDYDHDFDDDEE